MPEKNNLNAKISDLPVARGLAVEMEKNGPMPVAAFMGAASSHYYATKDPFGTEGDFTTAPEISQMFGEMIGAWLVDAWMQMGQPERVQLIELGPGRGTLMVDIMRTVSSWPEFKSAVSIHMIETSPQLRQAQASTLKAYRPTWYDRLEEVPVGFSFIVANEFFDALPIHQFKKVRGLWQERAVGYDSLEDSFFFTTVPLTFDIGKLMPPEFMEVPDGGIYEVSPASLGVMDVICRRIADNGGASLIIDYGHTTPGLGDTLQSISRHKYSDVLDNPGGKDVTAHVDFSILKTVAQERVQVHGAVTQAAFLKSLGIEQRAEKLAEGATAEQKADIATGLHRLTASSEMGYLFKVMGLTPKTIEIIPAGFGDEISDNPA